MVDQLVLNLFYFPKEEIFLLYVSHMPDSALGTKNSVYETCP